MKLGTKWSSTCDLSAQNEEIISSKGRNGEDLWKKISDLLAVNVKA